jgi:hypothetical protein
MAAVWRGNGELMLWKSLVGYSSPEGRKQA